jgi:hypothetical protein
MPREITDEEYNRLMTRAQIADFVEPIYNHPQLGKEAKRLIKQAYPQVQIPDYDIESRINQRIDHETKRFEEHERKKATEAQEARFQEIRKKTQDEYGFTDDGMKDLEKFMLEKNIGDYEVAAQYRVAKQPRQSDADADDGRDHFWNHSKQEGFADISADPEAWARKQILGAIRRDEDRNKQRRF